MAKDGLELANQKREVTNKFAYATFQSNETIAKLNLLLQNVKMELDTKTQNLMKLEKNFFDLKS